MKDKVWSFGNRVFQSLRPDVVFAAVTGLIIASELFAIGVLLYLGTFNRYLADDYCEMVIMKNKPLLPAVFNIYMDGIFRGTYRFSKFLLIGVSELFGTHNVQFLPTIMILIWLAGMIWSISQLRKLGGIRWPVILDFLLAVSIVFFSAWQAPNRFQTFFWRSSMAAHFAPLVFMPLLSGFVLSQINSAKKPSHWVSLFVFLVSFFVGGFSEPPTATMIVIMILLIPIAWRWDDDLKRRSAMGLLSYSLAGSLLAFFAMFFSPGNVSHGKTSFTELFVTFEQTIRYTFNFLDDTVWTLPLPSLLSILTSFFVFFVFLIKSENQPLVPRRKRGIWIGLVFVLLIQFLLIAASFAPSAYGQSYPAERARFLGRLIMTMALLFGGALLGVLCASSRVLYSRRRGAFLLGALALFVLAFYPFRAGMSLLADVPDYRQWAFAWDLRETEIYRSIANGEKDLVVRWLPTKEGVKEIDGDTRHWVNQCAAEYYEVDTIRSVPMDNE